MSKRELIAASRRLSEGVEGLRFGPPVAYVYNPLSYARSLHESYLQRFGDGGKQVVLVGMNPGPWGMAQTGVPFGEVELVREWLGLEGEVKPPGREHPKRPVQGLACRRSEVSGRRLWGWARSRFGSPERFFSRFFIANYCPLLFLEESGRNRTPDRLPVEERRPLEALCDQALRRTVEVLGPRWVVGVGRFAERRAREALQGMEVEVGGMLHPSPASPAANQGWEERALADLQELGVPI